MNILVSSTVQWNPGDEFILMGVRNLLSELISGSPINWVLYNRNPDLFQDGFCNPAHKDKIWTNSLIHGNPHCIDLALVAGTPEWFGLPMRRFYALANEGLWPVLLLGVGYVDASIQFSEDEKRCFARCVKLAVTRDPYADRELKKLPVATRLLPCPALFASRAEKVFRKTKKIGFVLQGHEVVNQSVSLELLHACVDWVKRLRISGWEVEVVCNYIDEFQKNARTLEPVRYSYDAKDYLEIMAEYTVVVSTRLHSAVLASSLGKPAILLNSADSRCQGAAAQFPYIYSCTPDCLAETLNEVLGNFKQESLWQWKEEARNQYLKLLRPVLRQFQAEKSFAHEI